MSIGSDALLRILLIIIFLLPTQLLSKPNEPVQLKSALIYNLLRYVHWPQEESIQFYTIAVIGDDKALLSELVRASKFVKVNDAQVKVIKVQAEGFDANAIQLLFIAKNKSHLVPEISTSIRQTDTLVVTDESPHQQDFMINLYPEKNKYKFEVNSSNIIFEGLTLHKDILLLGGTQLDVAKLLRSSEDSLLKAKLEVLTNEKILTEQQIKIDQYQDNLAKLQLVTTQYQEDSSKLKAKLKAQTDEFKTQQQKLHSLTEKSTDITKQLANSKRSLSDKKNAFDKINKELNVKANMLSQNKKQMTELKDSIAEHSAILDKQKRAISSHQEEIDQKNNQISFHQYLLTAVASVLVLFIIMSVIIYFSYQSKKKVKENLLHSYKNIKIIGQLGIDITACLDFNEAMEALYGHVQNLMDTNVFAIGLLNEENQSIDYNFAYGNGVQYKPYRRLLKDKNQFGVYCIDKKKSIFINDVENEYQEYFANYHPQQHAPLNEKEINHVTPVSLLYIPIISQNKVKGVISVQSDRRFAFSQTDLDLLQTLAAYTSVALDNSQNHEKIKQAQEHIVMQEKMASLGLLTAGVAHEINNPTNFTRLSAQNLQVDLKEFKALLIELAGEPIDVEVKTLFDDKFTNLYEKLAIILDGTQRIKDTVQDLRSFTRQDSSEKCVVKLSETLDSTIRLVRSKYKKTIEISHEFTDDPSLDCRPALLNQVFMNIIVNGCDAIYERQLQDTALKGQIKISLTTNKQYIVIKFEDNGAGMSDETQQQLFEPFYTTKEMGEGTGLGLAISYGIIKKHKGEITISSILGEGSCFTISLPY